MQLDRQKTGTGVGSDFFVPNFGAFVGSPPKSPYSDASVVEHGKVQSDMCGLPRSTDILGTRGFRPADPCIGCVEIGTPPPTALSVLPSSALAHLEFCRGPKSTSSQAIAGIVIVIGISEAGRLLGFTLTCDSATATRLRCPTIEMFADIGPVRYCISM
jgi:hypothetical protein